MPVHPLRLAPEAAHAELAEALEGIRSELGLPLAFPSEVDAEAAAAIARGPEPAAAAIRDATDIPFITIDPAGATDLDQALAIARDGTGMVVHYAIADVPAFVQPGGAIDAEARRRGMTLYAADGRIPLHPAPLSEGAASLLPGRERRALLWTMRVDDTGEVTSVELVRARIRSRRQLSYDEAEAQLRSGDGPEFAVLELLVELGDLRLQLEAARGGASLSTPEILVVDDGGRYALRRRTLGRIERANAQLSLMTGMAAARIMLDGGVGIVRTMPPADEESIERFRRRTRALGAPWPEAQRYGDYLRSLEGDDPRHLAILHAAAALFRGASYTPFDGAAPADALQAAIGAPYAHVTAPLRRLVDRFALECCVALSAGEPIAGWVRDALPQLPSAMGRAANAAGRLDRLTLAAVEAAVLAPQLGESFDAVVLSSDSDESTVQLVDPAVEAECEGALPVGESVRVRLIRADIATGEVRFTRA